MQMGHVLDGCELTVGDVEKVSASGQLTEQLLSLLVRAVIRGLATLNAKLHQESTIAGHGEDVE